MVRTQSVFRFNYARPIAIDDEDYAIKMMQDEDMGNKIFILLIWSLDLTVLTLTP